MLIDLEARWGERIKVHSAPGHFEKPLATLAVKMMVMILRGRLVEPRQIGVRHAPDLATLHE